MTLITYKPRTSIVSEIDNWFDSLWSFDSLDNQINKFQPRFDISQNKTSYFITADLPGMNKKDVDISLSDDEKLATDIAISDIVEGTHKGGKPKLGDELEKLEIDIALELSSVKRE